MIHQPEQLNSENRSLDQIPNAPKRTEPVGFLLRLAKALHTYGLPAYELENTINGCAAALGFGVQCMSTPTSISLTILPPDSPPQTFIIRVAPGDMNLEKLRQTSLIAEKVISGELTSDHGAEALKKIAKMKPYYHAVVLVLAFAIVSSCIARIFSGGLYEVGCAGIIGMLVGMLTLASRRSALLNHLLPATCAFLGTVVAIFIDHWVPQEIAISVVVISGLIILLPGLSLTIAMAELATQNMVSGTARLTSAATVFIQLAFGSALAAEVGQLLELQVSGAGVEQVSFWSIWLAVAIAAVGLVPTFEARVKDSFWFLLSAMVAYMTVYFATPLLGASLGAFCGAIAVGLLAKVVANLFSVPGAMIMMPGFIILVPGSVGYRSILALVEKDIIGGLEIAFDVAVIGISLVTGFLISSMLSLPKGGAKDEY